MDGVWNETRIGDTEVKAILGMIEEGMDLSQTMDLLITATTSHHRAASLVKRYRSDMPPEVQFQRSKLLHWNRHTRHFLRELQGRFLGENNEDEADKLDDPVIVLDFSRMLLAEPTKE